MSDEWDEAVTYGREWASKNSRVVSDSTLQALLAIGFNQGLQAGVYIPNDGVLVDAVAGGLNPARAKLGGDEIKKIVVNLKQVLEDWNLLTVEEL